VRIVSVLEEVRLVLFWPHNSLEFLSLSLTNVIAHTGPPPAPKPKKSSGDKTKDGGSGDKKKEPKEKKSGKSSKTSKK
jgi:hypothetical protein